MTLNDIKSKVGIKEGVDWLGPFVVAHLDLKQMARYNRGGVTRGEAEEHVMRQMIHRLYADRRSEFCELVLQIRLAMQYHNPEMMKLLDKLEDMSVSLPPGDV